MTILQIAIISILYKNQGEPIDKTNLLKRNSLAFWGLVYSEDEIEQDFWRLIQAEYIQYIQPGSRKVELTELGIDYYKWELNSRKDEENRKREISAREEKLYNAQLDNIKSSILTNKAQLRLSILTLIFIGVGLFVSIMQYYGVSKVSLHERIKVEILPGDFPKQIILEIDSASRLYTESHKKVPTMEEVFGKENDLPIFKK